MLKKFDDFSDVGDFWADASVCVWFVLFAVPVAPRSCSFPVVWL